MLFRSAEGFGNSFKLKAFLKIYFIFPTQKPVKLNRNFYNNNLSHSRSSANKKAPPIVHSYRLFTRIHEHAP